MKYKDLSQKKLLSVIKQLQSKIIEKDEKIAELEHELDQQYEQSEFAYIGL